MPTCPICHSDLPKPPEDIQDWFRCQICGTPLQISTTIGKLIFGISIGLLLCAYWALFFAFARRPHFRGISDFAFHLYSVFFYAIITGIYAFLVRLLWKSSFFQPRPCDPYSSLNLSDDRKKLRGNR